MKWIEAEPLPKECQSCRNEECYNCDNAGKRWYLSQKEELQLRRKSLVGAMERMKKQITEIDRELALLEDL